MREHDRVVVHVDHPGARRGPVRDLVHVVGGGQARADVEQLPDAGLADQVAHYPAEHGPLRLHADLDFGQPGHDLVAHSAVGGKVVPAAKQIVVDARRVRARRVNGTARRF